MGDVVENDEEGVSGWREGLMSSFEVKGDESSEVASST